VAINRHEELLSGEGSGSRSTPGGVVVSLNNAFGETTQVALSIGGPWAAIIGSTLKNPADSW